LLLESVDFQSAERSASEGPKEMINLKTRDVVYVSVKMPGAEVFSADGT